MKISVVGTGYVGLVTGVCLAEKKHQVVCVDKDIEKLESIKNGKSPFYEEGLNSLLVGHIGQRLQVTNDLYRAVLDTDLTLVAVGTPFVKDKIDLQYIRQVAREIGKALKEKDKYHVVVIKSTVVPGTTDDVVLPLLEKYSCKKAGFDFGVGMNPEFLREGAAIDDFMNPDRIVIGGIDSRSRSVLAKVYQSFSGVDQLEVNNRTAEMIKYTANSLLATLISFSNEIGNMCASIRGVDVVDVMHGVHLDKRISPITEDGQRIFPQITTYLEAGCGFGGSCFPKDVKALIAHGRRANSEMSLLQTVIDINTKQPYQVLDRLYRHFPALNKVQIAVLGLAFKPGTDDMRESPAIPILKKLIADQASITAYDPVAKREAEKLFPIDKVIFCDSLEKTVENAQAILIITRWDEFKNLPAVLKKTKSQPVIIDGRRMLPKNCVPHYEGIGI